MPTVPGATQYLRREFIRTLTSIAIGCFVVGHVGLAFAQNHRTNGVWQQYLQWLPSAPPTDGVGPIHAQYRTRLVAAGVSEAEADKQLAVIRKMLRSTPRSPAHRVQQYLLEPECFRIQHGPKRPSRVRSKGPQAWPCARCGHGAGPERGFLSCRGLGCDGVRHLRYGDWKSPTRTPRALASKVNTVLKSREEFDFGVAQWDLIVITYETIPLETPSYVERLRNSLRAGGLIVVETTASDAGQPLTRSVDVDPARLLRAFDGFRILRFEDGVAMPDWGKEKPASFGSSRKRNPETCANLDGE